MNVNFTHYPWEQRSIRVVTTFSFAIKTYEIQTVIVSPESPNRSLMGPERHPNDRVYALRPYRATLKRKRNLREFLMNFIKSELPFVLMCWPVLFFSSSVMGDGRPGPSSSWKFKFRPHFLAFHSFITPPPYTAISRRQISIRRTCCAFKKPNYISHFTLSGILDFLIQF
jgi:hypothetical protein